MTRDPNEPWTVAQDNEAAAMDEEAAKWDESDLSDATQARPEDVPPGVFDVVEAYQGKEARGAAEQQAAAHLAQARPEDVGPPSGGVSRAEVERRALHGEVRATKDAEIARLREALKPLATLAAAIPPAAPDEWTVLAPVGLFRRAAEVLK
jgi:hypothetical protein